MSSTSTELDVKLDDVVSWRIEVLERAGCPGPLAIELGQEVGIDLHAATDLLEAGCPPELVARILA